MEWAQSREARRGSLRVQEGEEVTQPRAVCPLGPGRSASKWGLKELSVPHGDMEAPSTPRGPLGTAHPRTPGWSHDTRSSAFVLQLGVCSNSPFF